MIYYCYEKATGKYAGSGTPEIETETHSSTTVAAPEMQEGETAIFDGEKWTVVKMDEAE